LYHDVQQKATYIILKLDKKIPSNSSLQGVIQLDFIWLLQN
jgi:hypothetical protein